MTENDPKPTTLAALLLATVVLPPLVAATVLRGEPALRSEPQAPARHAALCADAGPAPSAPAVVAARPVKPTAEKPLLACGAAVSAVTP